MQFSPESSIFKGALYSFNCLGVVLPYEFTGPKDEYLACRRSAWLGVNLNNTPIYDVSGPDAEKALNRICVNKDFSLMKTGDSKHALICNERGQMLADGVIMKKENGVYRSYWLAPVLEYFITTSRGPTKTMSISSRSTVPSPWRSWKRQRRPTCMTSSSPRTRPWISAALR